MQNEAKKAKFSWARTSPKGVYMAVRSKGSEAQSFTKKKANKD
jgi:hypothetical protein